MDMSRLAIVAALEREVRPLVKHWQVRKREHAGREFRFYESGEAVLVCGGIGPEAARRAAEAVIVLYRPELLYSVGYAGALDPTLKVGNVLTPAQVINGNDGSRVDLSKGQGTLLSQSAVASVAQKSRLRQSYGAQAIDMEASAVARAAEARGVGFQAVKVISDEFNFELPVLDRFVDAEGRFHHARFTLHALVRPWLWLRLVHLASNSAGATQALCAELRQILSAEVPADSSAQITETR
jgi:adenosylhomocysteine nucleosidase